MNLSHFTAAERNAIRDAVELVTTADPNYHLLPDICSYTEAVLYRSAITEKLSSNADPLFFGDELKFIYHALNACCDRSVELSVLFGKALSTTAAASARHKIVSLTSFS